MEIEIKHYQLKYILQIIRKRYHNDLKKSNTWKIQLTIAINFISFKDDDKEHVIHTIETMINDRADEVIKELFKFLQNRYQNNLEESMKGAEFVFD